MFLGLDIGNTHIRCGFFTEGILPAAVFTAETEKIQTNDDLSDCISMWIEEYKKKGFSDHVPDGAVYSSVVPRINPLCEKVFYSLCGRLPLCVSAAMDPGFEIRYQNPAALGADRITNAAAAYELFSGKDCIVVDIGTAVTFCVLLKEKIFDGGIIAPGFGISADALAAKTSQLFRTDIAPLQSVVGRSSAEGIQSGIFYGGISMIEGLIARIEKEYTRTFTVIITGGGSEIIKPYLPADVYFDSLLTMKGLALLYQRFNN